MKFEQTRLSLVPRSAANCLDLALWFCGRHFGPLFGLWALFVIPLCGVTYYCARSSEWGFLAATACGFFGSAPLGVMLTAGVARTAFGEEFTLRKMLADLRTDGTLALKVLALRIPLGLGLLMCGIPGLLLGVRWGYLVESRVLTRMHAHRHDRRTGELIKLEFADLVVRSGMIVCAGLVGWLLAELTVDVAWTILFGRSLFFGRLSELGSVLADEIAIEDYAEQVQRLATGDPQVLTLHLATGLAAYIVCRIAWFLCYIDLRVRRDCWDLELEMLDEAQRLGGAKAEA